MSLYNLNYLQLRVVVQQIHDQLLLGIIIIFLTKDLPYQVKQFTATDATIPFQLESLILLESTDNLKTNGVALGITPVRTFEEASLDQLIYVVEILQQIYRGQTRMLGQIAQPDVRSIAEVHHQAQHQCLVGCEILLFCNLLQAWCNMLKELRTQLRILGVTHHILYGLELGHFFFDLIDLAHDNAV